MELSTVLISIKNEYPTHNTDLNPDDMFLHHHDRFVVYEMMLDSLMYKGVKQTELSPPVPLQAEWSPKSVPGMDRCMLAVRSSSGGVYVYYNKMRDWLELSDVSKMRYSMVSKNWKKVENNPENLRSRINQLFATALCWAEEESTGDLILWVAYGDGSLIVWKVDQSGAEYKDTITLDNMSKITHISWKDFLIAGDNTGKVRLIFPMSRNVLEFWSEEDQIPLESSLSFPGSSGGWFVIAIKGSCIVAAFVSADGKTVQKGAKNFGTLGITGLVHFKNNKILISHLCGSVEIVTLKLKESSVDFVFYKLNHKMNITDCNVHGIAVSKNLLIYAAAQSVYVPHDHLQLREPSRITFFTFTSAKKVWSLVKSLESAENLSFGQIWDLFEILRLSSEKSNWQEPENIEHAIKSPVLNRKLLIMTIEEALKAGQDEEATRLKAALDILNKSVLARHLLKTLSSFLNSSQTDLEEASVQLMTNWLRNFEMNYPALLTSEEQEFINGLPKVEQVEKCTICANDTLTPELLGMTCINGHTLPRCCLSLIQCSSTPYRICPACDQCCLLNPLFNQEPRCIFCNDLMIEENY